MENDRFVGGGNLPAWANKAARDCPEADFEAFMRKLDESGKRKNAEGQARYREEQRRKGRIGRLMYLTEDEFNKIKRYIETLRAESS
jgi:hypothetical protein